MSNTNQYKFLPLTLTLGTLGGIAVPLVKRGTPLPAKRKQRFATAADNQKSVTVSIFLGESKISNKNIALGKFDATGIHEAPRGEAEVDIQFEVDQNCQVRVSAIPVKFGKETPPITKNFNPPLTKEKVDAMLRKAIDEQQEDELLAEQIEAKNNASQLLTQAEKYLQSQQQYGIRSAVDGQIEAIVASLGLALEDDNLGEILEKSKRLKELIPNTTLDFNFFGATDPFSGFFAPTRRPTKKQSPAGSKPHEPASPTASSKAPPSTDEIIKSKEGVFAAGQHFDAKRVIRDLFSIAAKDIVIVDAYLGEDVLNLLTVKRNGVHVRLLTGKVSPSFLTLSRDFNRQYKNLEIRTSKTFHDRFIFIDNCDFYHFGASLEHLGNKTFMFSKIEEPLIISTLKTHWETGWNHAVVVL